jgi:hypothetical protein
MTIRDRSSSVPDDRYMNHTEHRSRGLRPLRRMRRWARHTPNGEIAITLICLGVALIATAAILAVAM